MAEEGELSKRIVDLHRRLDDLRADQLQLRQELGQMRQEMVAGFAQLRQEIAAGDASLRQEMVQLRVDLSRQSRLFLQLMAGGFALLTLLVTLFQFLRW